MKFAFSRFKIIEMNFETLKLEQSEKYCYNSDSNNWF